jgi:hypothetical protein
MKNPTRVTILTGGVLNLLLALFHIYLCYVIFKAYASADFYPLMQMLAIAGTVFIFFLAYTSLFCATELMKGSLGMTVIMLNILLYLSRALGEVILFPHPKPIIIGLCILLVLMYGYVFFNGKAGSEAASQ